jgi:hypothetical protein
LGAALALLAALAHPPAASAAGSITVRLTPSGVTTLAQGGAFRVKASARNGGQTQVAATVVLRLVATGSGAAVDAVGWDVDLAASATATRTIPLATSQWLADLGGFEVHPQIGGVDVGTPLAFTVTAPTVVVPTFEDVTAASGLTTTIEPSQCGAYAAGAAWGDVNGDGFLDLYVPRGRQPAQLFMNDGTGHFTDEAAARGVQDLGLNGIGAVFADYDNDGDQDLFVANDPVGTAVGDRLYQNDGTGHFTDVAAAAGVAGDTADVSATWGDYDGDGYLDLYVVSNSPCLPPVMYQTDHLYHNDGDGTFTDVTSYLPGADGDGAGYQAAWFDGNGDGRPDLYLANDRWGGPHPDPNKMWRNDGPGANGTWLFTDVSADSGTGWTMNSMGIAVGDPNRDLKADFAVSNIRGNVLAQGDGAGHFTNVAEKDGAARDYQDARTRAVTWGLAFADLNLDGWEDLVVAAGEIQDEPIQPNEVFTNAGDGTFLDLSSLSGADDPASGRGIAVADYDRDGLLDVFVVNRDGQPILYHNVTPATGHWLELHLTGTVSASDACGARVVVTAGGGRQLRIVMCGSALSSGSDPTVHLGLGTSTTASRVDITWPSGRHQVLRNVAGDQLREVVEPA